MDTLRKLSVVLVLGALSAYAYADKKNNCDSTCESKVKQSSFQNISGIAAIDAMAESGTTNSYKNCAAGFSTISGAASYVSEKTPIFGFYHKGSLVYTKNGKPVKLQDEACFKTETRVVGCDSGFSGSRMQSSKLTQSPSGAITSEPWQTYSNSCSKVEKTTESCAQGYTGSIEKQRTVTESNAGSKIYGSWTETLNNCKEIPKAPTPTPTPTQPTPKPPTIPDTGLTGDIVNGFQTAPVLRMDSYSQGKYRNIVLRDLNNVYYSIMGDDSSAGITFADKAAYEQFTCKYTNWCQDSYGAYLYTPKKSFYSGGTEVAYFYGDWFLFYDVFMVFPQMDKFSAKYTSGAWDYSNPNISSTYYCPIGFGIAPNRLYCSKEFKGSGGFVISPIF